MAERDLLQNPPQKVLLIYHAVKDLICEGADINTMKVLDITERAGIGKGTAYEYFSSKEEIITKALAYEIREQFQELMLILEKSHGFKQQVDAILDFIAEKFGQSQMFFTLVRIGTGSYEVPESFRQEYDQICRELGPDEVEKRMDVLITTIMLQGQKEGLIRETDSAVSRMAFIGQMIAFATNLAVGTCGKQPAVPQDQAKKFVYESLIKSLN